MTWLADHWLDLLGWGGSVLLVYSLLQASVLLAMRPERILEVGPFAGSRHRHLHVVRKIGPTPDKLPRRAGIAKKRPLP